MVTALVFPRASPALLREALPAGARVIAVDAGADACLAAGVTPDLVVGDLDSVSAATLQDLRARGVSIERHEAAKRDTDGALALAHAKDEEIVFVGAFGGRADHALANLHLLARAGAMARAWARDDDATTWIVTPERPLALDRPAGTTISVIPFGGDADGVTEEGFAWPLHDATMRTGDPYGVSNRTLAPPQRVAVRRGVLIVSEPR